MSSLCSHFCANSHGDKVENLRLALQLCLTSPRCDVQRHAEEIAYLIHFEQDFDVVKSAIQALSYIDTAWVHASRVAYLLSPVKIVIERGLNDTEEELERERVRRRVRGDGDHWIRSKWQREEYFEIAAAAAACIGKMGNTGLQFCDTYLYPAAMFHERSISRAAIFALSSLGAVDTLVKLSWELTMRNDDNPPWESAKWTLQALEQTSGVSLEQIDSFAANLMEIVANSEGLLTPVQEDLVKHCARLATKTAISLDSKLKFALLSRNLELIAAIQSKSSPSLSAALSKHLALAVEHLGASSSSVEEEGSDGIHGDDKEAARNLRQQQIEMVTAAMLESVMSSTSTSDNDEVMQAVSLYRMQKELCWNTLEDFLANARPEEEEEEQRRRRNTIGMSHIVEAILLQGAEEEAEVLHSILQSTMSRRQWRMSFEHLYIVQIILKGLARKRVHGIEDSCKALYAAVVIQLDEALEMTEKEKDLIQMQQVLALCGDIDDVNDVQKAKKYLSGAVRVVTQPAMMTKSATFGK